MKQIDYHSPHIEWLNLSAETLVCDSYDSGIDDYEYVEIDWNA